MLNVTIWAKMSQAGVFVYMSLSLCTTQDNMNWMHALKKTMQLSSREKIIQDDEWTKLHTTFITERYWLCAHAQCSWIGNHPAEVLVEVMVRNFCCTQLFFLSHTHVPYSSTQHFCKITRSPSYSNYNRPICEEAMVESRNITSNLIVTERRSSEAWQLQWPDL